MKRKQTERRKAYAARSKKRNAKPCLRCGKKESHFVPPTLHEDGFFSCQRIRYIEAEN